MTQKRRNSIANSLELRIFCIKPSCVQPHFDVIAWKRFPRYWPFARGIHRSPVDFPHKGLVTLALIFYLTLAKINDWINNQIAGDLRRHDVHCDVNIMSHKRWRHHDKTVKHSIGARQEFPRSYGCQGVFESLWLQQSPLDFIQTTYTKSGYWKVIGVSRVWSIPRELLIPSTKAGRDVELCFDAIFHDMGVRCGCRWRSSTR